MPKYEIWNQGVECGKAIQNEGDDILEVWNQGVLWWKKVGDLIYRSYITEISYFYYICYSQAESKFFGYGMEGISPGHYVMHRIESSDAEEWVESTTDYDTTYYPASQLYDAASYEDFIELEQLRCNHRSFILSSNLFRTFSNITGRKHYDLNMNVSDIQNSEVIHIKGKMNGVYIGFYSSAYYGGELVTSSDLINWYALAVDGSNFSTSPDYCILNSNRGILICGVASDRIKIISIGHSGSLIEELVGASEYYPYKPYTEGSASYYEKLIYWNGYYLWTYMYSDKIGVAGLDLTDAENTFFHIGGTIYGDIFGIRESIILDEYLLLLDVSTLKVFSDIEELKSSTPIKSFSFYEEGLFFRYHISLLEDSNNVYIMGNASTLGQELISIIIDKQDLLNWIES